MNTKFDELTKSLAQSVTRRAALKKFSLGLATIIFAVLLAQPSQAANPNEQISTVLDPAGDAAFPYDLYGAPVPAYLDVVKASVSYSRGVFHFEIQMRGEIPASPSPDFTTSVNHMGPTFGILTNRKTAESGFNFFGHTDTYHFNFLVGALYSFADNGAGLPLGWTGFLLDVNTFMVVPIPLEIRGDNLIFETSAASLGDPSSLQWVVGSECDPVPITNEKRKSVLMVDFVPDHGYASWPSQQP